MVATLFGLAFAVVATVCACTETVDEDELSLEADMLRASAQVGACVTPPAGMVLWHSYDETSGPTALDHSFGAGAAHGVHVNVTPGLAGQVALALGFNGATSGIRVPDDPVLDFGEHSFAVDFWIYPAVGEQQAVILSKGTQGGSHWTMLQGLQITWDGAFLNVTLANNGNSSIAFTNGPGLIVPGQWNFVAINVDRDQEMAQTFVNGVDNGMFPLPDPGSISTSADLLIGDRGTLAFTWTLDGRLDEFEIFKRTLTVAEIGALYSAGPDGKCKSCPPASSVINYSSTDPQACAQVDTPVVDCEPSEGWHRFDNNCGCGCIKVAGDGMQ